MTDLVKYNPIFLRICCIVALSLSSSESQSFIFTSTNGGTLYIKPLEVSPQDLHTMSLDGIIDSVVDFDNQVRETTPFSLWTWRGQLNFQTCWAYC